MTSLLLIQGFSVYTDRVKTNAAHFRRPQRAISLPVSRAYRIVRHAAACILADTQPWELEAVVQAKCTSFWHRKELLGLLTCLKAPSPGGTHS